MTAPIWLHNLACTLTCQPGKIIDTLDQYRHWKRIQIATILLLACPGLVPIPNALSLAGKLLLLQASILLFQLGTPRHLNVNRSTVMASGGGLFAACMTAMGADIGLINLHLLTVFICTIYALHQKAWTPEESMEKETDSQGPQEQMKVSAKMQTPPSSTLLQMGPTIAHYRGSEIPGWFIDPHGRKFEFDRVFTGSESETIAPDEALVFPGFIYRPAKDPEA